jgi:uncharacterized protein (DUF305 family)
MAKVALKYATGPETKRMAQTIIEAREKTWPTCRPG